MDRGSEAARHRPREAPGRLSPHLLVLVLHRCFHVRFPQGDDLPAVVRRHREPRCAHDRPFQARDAAHKRRGNRSVGIRRPPLGRALGAERYPNHARLPLPAVHRPSDASGDVDQEARRPEARRQDEDVQRRRLFEAARAGGTVRVTVSV